MSRRYPDAACRIRRRAQTSLEFLVLTAFMFFVFSAFFLVIQEQSGFVKQQQRLSELRSTADIITQEVAMANRVVDGYNRTFELPLTINSEPYLIFLNVSNEVTIKTFDEEYLVFLPTNITLIVGGSSQQNGQIQRGRNRITKLDGVVFVESVGS